MSPNITTSIQDYLKRIYELTEGGGSASTNSLAEELHIKPASVTGMLQRLAEGRPPLVNYRKHQGVTLTASGRRAALEVIRHHRLLEAWLMQTLGYSWDEVHDEAERLEHVISEDLEHRMAAALGDPARDPHGEPIPSADLKMPPNASGPLSSLRPLQKATIRSIKAPDSELLRHLKSLGLLPGVEIELIDYSPLDHNSTVKVGDRTAVLGPAVTARILVEPV
jgi:DtxR family transcriptional regulator, Mn-dependent transcriptional regulator